MTQRQTEESEEPGQSPGSGRIRSLPTWLNDHRILLTAICALSLGLSFAPGLGLLSYLAVLVGSVEAIRSAYASVKERHLDVNLLMILAAAGAIVVGRVTDAAALLFLFSLSTTLESIAMSRTHAAIESLIRLRPAQAWLVNGEQTISVPVEALRVGDLIRIHAFENVPVDAEITEGCSSIDQSAMTGESVPVSCAVGAPIVGGTQNLDGMLIARVTAAVGDSALDRIVALVKDAQENKASGERISEWFGERYTYFVLASFFVSLVVRRYLGESLSTSFYSSLTLLVGMSPCALVISTPATTLSALAWCARNGVLVRGGEFIEKLGAIRAVALDKTGTLTMGQPTLVSMAYLERVADSRECPVHWNKQDSLGRNAEEILRFAAAAESFSNHPIARSVVSLAKQRCLEIPVATENRVLSGLGVEAEIGEGRILVGRERLLLHCGVAIPLSIVESIRTFEQDGFTVSLVVTPTSIAALAFSDSLRTGAAEFVQHLQEAGVRRIAILTGDRAETAASVARAVGITECIAGLLPADKTEHLRLMESVGPVMMVGDGVNDAPSLAMASVGVAMGGLGSDVAMNAADIILVHDRIDRLPDLISLGKKTVATIRWNLGFAGAMILTLTLTSLFYRLPLPIAVLGHEGSTVLVILNGLRLLQGPGKHNQRLNSASDGLGAKIFSVSIAGS